MVAAEYTVLGLSMNIANVVETETRNYNYIYPVIRVSYLNDGDII